MTLVDGTRWLYSPIEPLRQLAVGRAASRRRRRLATPARRIL
jgi:hypothetical protein